jgi:uncharacterized membrane protein HdeD (DUF308 family)
MNHHIMARFWWILLGRGALGIFLGISALGWFFYLDFSPRPFFGTALSLEPFSTLAVLLLFLGLYAFTDGVFSILLGAQDFGERRRWWGLMACGLLTCALGVCTWLRPDPWVSVLFSWIILWALVSGSLEFLQAFNKTEYRDRKKQFIFAGLCSLGFGLFAILMRGGGSLLLLLIGIYALLHGIPMVVMGMRLRGHFKHYVH